MVGEMKAIIVFLSVFGLLIQTTPTFAASCQDANRLMERAGNSGKSESLLREALRACPNHVVALNNLALLLEDAGRLKEAETYYRRATEADPMNPAPWAGLGDVHTAQGEAAEAVASYMRFLDLLEGERMRGNPSGLVQYENEYRDKLRVARNAAGMPEKEPQVISADFITRSLTQKPKFQTRGLSVMARPFINIQILFETASAQILPSSMKQLEQVARALTGQSLSKSRIVIEGHTDSVGKAEYNQKLSEQRSESVRAVLANRFGVAAQRLKVVGFGEAMPIASNTTELGRSRNRRVTFVNEDGG
jgi:OOP family OmpA-OmpF porin